MGRLPFKSYIIACALVLLSWLPVWSQPVNDNYASASVISLGTGNFAFGTFYSDNINLTGGTSQPGEYLLNPVYSRTIWYKFSIPTHRRIRIRVLQSPETMPSNEVGFLVYKGTPGIPTQADMATFTPLFSIGSYSENVCLEQGDYYVQVVARTTATGNVYVELLSAPPDAAAYDLSSDAIVGGTVTNPFTANINWSCLSIDTTAELCSSLGPDYTKSAWLTFTTDNHIDLLYMQLSGALTDYGLRLYEGDVKTAGIGGVSLVMDCDKYNAGQEIILPCTLINANTTYSVQLLASYLENGLSTFTVKELGEGTTAAPKPIQAGFPATNDFGLISPTPFPGVSSVRSDFFSCEAWLVDPTVQCGTVNPANEVVFNGVSYQLSIWFTFEVDDPTNLVLQLAVQSAACSTANHGILVRLFERTTNNNCTSISFPGDLYKAQVTNSGGTFSVNCLPRGKYSIQLLGKYDASNLFACTSHFGRKVQVTLQASAAGTNDFALESAGDVDRYNSGSPLSSGTTYNSTSSAFACIKSVLPSNFTCDPVIDRAKYREFTLSDSGFVRVSRIVYNNPARNHNSRTLVYRNSANQLATAQSAFSHPQTFNGLTDLGSCSYYTQNVDTTATLNFCLIPGQYSVITYGDSTETGMISNPSVRFVRQVTHFANPAAPDNMGDVIAAGLNVQSQPDTFSCRDNPATIAGLNPCNNATKLVYREFYLSKAARITVTEQFNQNSVFRIFSGRASSGLGGLSPAPDAGTQCYNSPFSTPTCNLMPVGWYTVVSYANGAGYANSHNHYAGGGSVNQPTRIRVTVDTSTVDGPLYNRPHKACVANNNQPLSLANNGDSEVRVRSASYTLCTENMRQPVDTPFSAHPINACVGMVRSAYYVFRTNEEANVRISGTSGFARQVYPLDVRVDSMLLPATPPIVPCENTSGTLVICRLQPGTYTLVVYGTPAQNCHSVTPVIQLDTVGLSRFDFASKAYDFGPVPPDNQFHDGKPGDVHPTRPAYSPSTDFFFCTTGAASSDPAVQCEGSVYPGIYPDVPNNVYSGAPASVRRNLWYSFVIKGKGHVTVRLRNRTGAFDGSRSAIPPFTVYRSDADGTLSIPQLLAAGELDSTIADGLTFIGNNILPSPPNPPCTTGPTVNFSFARDICIPDTISRRYFVVVSLNEGQTLPVVQVDLQVRFDPLITINSSSPYDYYSFANQLGAGEILPPYTMAPPPRNVDIPGGWSDMSCSSNDDADRMTDLGCTDTKKTVWYKFMLDSPGLFRYRLEGDDTSSLNGIESFLMIPNSPGDSVLGTAFTQMNPSFRSAEGGAQWNNYCLPAGEYYLFIYTCDQADTTTLRPVIHLEDLPGNVMYDHFSDANQIGFGQALPPYNTAPVPMYNEINGAWGHLSCATTDEADMNYSLGCTTQKKSIWYKVRTGSKALFRYKLERQDGGSVSGINTRLFIPTVPGDSVLGVGLTYLPHQFTSNQGGANWLNFCLPAGEYYIFVSTCNPSDTSVVRPVIFVDDIPGGQLYDYFSGHNVVGFGEDLPPYTNSAIPVGVEVQGAWGDLSCATSDATDAALNTGCLDTKKTLWYKFNSGMQSIVRLRLERSGGGNPDASVRIFRQDDTGDTVLATGFTEIPYLSIVNQGGFNWQSYCLSPGIYYIHVSTCTISNTSIVRPVLISETSPGDDCDYAISTLAGGPGVYNAESIIYCNTIGGNFGEDNGNMGCLLGPEGFYSTWFRFEYTGSDVVDVLFQLNLNNFFNYGNTGNVRYRLFYGNNCSEMIEGQECASNAFINNSISCINGTVGAFYIQVVYPNTATGSLGFRYTVSTTADVDCNPFNPFFLSSDFLYSASCMGDTMFFTNYSTTGATLEYFWDFGFPGATSTEIDPFVTFPGEGNYLVKLWVINPQLADSAVSEQLLSIGPGGSPLNLGPDQTGCTSDTITIGQSLPMATFQWSTGESSPFIQVDSTGDYSVEVLLDGCTFRDTIHVELIPLSMRIPADTILCPDSEILVTAVVPPQAGVQWAGGPDEPEKRINQPGIYYVEASLGNCLILDSVLVNEIVLYPDLGNDTTVCLAAGYLLDPQVPPGSAYRWSDSSTGDTLLVFEPGVITVEVDSLGCLFRDTITLTALDISFELGNDTMICLGDELLLEPQLLEGVSTFWSNGDTNAFTTISQEDTYWLRVDFEACTYSDTLQLTTLEIPAVTLLYPTDPPCLDDCFKIDLTQQRASGWTWTFGEDSTASNLSPVSICFPEYGVYPLAINVFNICGDVEESLTFTVQIDTLIQISADTSVFAGDSAMLYVRGGGTDFAWEAPVSLDCYDCAETRGQFIDPGDVYVSLIDQYGCRVVDTIEVGVHKPFGIFVPNTFSPNDDGVNDIFRIHMYGVKALDFEIYNRYGEVIHTGNIADPTWNGKLNGRTVPLGVYPFVIRYQGYDGTIKEMKGRLTVL